MKEGRKGQLEELAERLGATEVSIDLLNTALTHTSYANENPAEGLESNQRLEFLGDAVLGMVVGDYLYRAYPDYPEGELTRQRALVVCAASLVEAARRLELGRYLQLGRGEEQGGGRERASLLADAFEAVVGAIYLSLGWEEVYERVIGYLQFALDSDSGRRVDYKTRLQEMIQRQTGQGVSYRVLQEHGPDHCKQFLVGVYFSGRELGRGEGGSKKEAEQKAARLAIEKIDSQPGLVSFHS
ncbi:MAG: ribonuclease III [Firmicutes bacterium]|nr:ribonuclease III [Bacillota bacterium]